MQSGAEEQGATVTIHLTTGMARAGVTEREKVSEIPGDTALIPSDLVDRPAKGGEVIDMGRAKRVETLEEVQATLRAIESACTALQMVVANQLEQERAHADEMPLHIYEQAAAEGALINDERDWTEDDERDALETEREMRWDVEARR
jgi:hypothetical protein